jgi:ferric-dicitrate binding protein FerR (iron transport regulator)
MSKTSDIAAAAAHWLVRLEAQTSPDLWDEFQAWLDEDRRHHLAFVRLRAAWTHVDLLKNLRPLDGTIDANLLARQRVKPATIAALGLHPLEGKSRPRKDLEMPDRRCWLAAAVAVATAAVAAWIGA